MAVYCDACETELNSTKLSKCCEADVWGVFRVDGDTYICQRCEKSCELIEDV